MYVLSVTTQIAGVPPFSPSATNSRARTSFPVWTGPLISACAAGGRPPNIRSSSRRTPDRTLAVFASWTISRCISSASPAAAFRWSVSISCICWWTNVSRARSSWSFFASSLRRSSSFFASSGRIPPPLDSSSARPASMRRASSSSACFVVCSWRSHAASSFSLNWRGPRCSLDLLRRDPDLLELGAELVLPDDEVPLPVFEVPQPVGDLLRELVPLGEERGVLPPGVPLGAERADLPLELDDPAAELRFPLDERLLPGLELLAVLEVGERVDPGGSRWRGGRSVRPRAPRRRRGPRRRREW